MGQFGHVQFRLPSGLRCSFPQGTCYGLAGVVFLLMDCGEKIAEDTIAVIGNASFPDFDLDRGDLGGVFSWEPPADTSKVTHYVVYMARCEV